MTKSVSVYNTVAEWMLFKGHSPQTIAKTLGPPWFWDIWHFTMAPKETIKQKCVAANLSHQDSERMWSNALEFSRQLTRETDIVNVYAACIAFITFTETPHLVVPAAVVAGNDSSAQLVLPSSKFAPIRMLARVAAADGLQPPDGYHEMSFDEANKDLASLKAAVAVGRLAASFASHQLHCEDEELEEYSRRYIEEVDTHGSNPLEDEAFEEDDRIGDSDDDLEEEMNTGTVRGGRVKRVGAAIPFITLECGRTVSMNPNKFTGKYVIYTVTHGRKNVIVARELKAEDAAGRNQWYVKAYKLNYPEGRGYTVDAKDVGGALHLENPFAELPGVQLVKLFLRKSSYILQCTAVMRPGINMEERSAGTPEGMNGLFKKYILSVIDNRAIEHGVGELVGDINLQDSRTHAIKMVNTLSQPTCDKTNRARLSMRGLIDRDTRLKITEWFGKNVAGAIATARGAGLLAAVGDGPAVQADDSLTAEANYSKSYVANTRDFNEVVWALYNCIVAIREALHLKSNDTVWAHLFKTVPGSNAVLDLTMKKLCDAEVVDVDAVIAAIPEGMGLLRAVWWLFTRKSKGIATHFSTSRLKEMSNTVGPKNIFQWTGNSAPRLIIMAFTDVIKEKPSIVLNASHHEFLKRMWQRVGYLQDKHRDVIDPDISTDWWLPPPTERDAVRPAISTDTDVYNLEDATGVTPLIQGLEVASQEVISNEAMAAAEAAAEAAAAHIAAPKKPFPSGKSRGRRPGRGRGRGRGG